MYSLLESWKILTARKKCQIVMLRSNSKVSTIGTRQGLGTKSRENFLSNSKLKSLCMYVTQSYQRTQKINIFSSILYGICIFGYPIKLSGYACQLQLWQHELCKIANNPRQNKRTLFKQIIIRLFNLNEIKNVNILIVFLS